MKKRTAIVKELNPSNNGTFPLKKVGVNEDQDRFTIIDARELFTKSGEKNTSRHKNFMLKIIHINPNRRLTNN